jgi:hypothetical protein
LLRYSITANMTRDLSPAPASRTSRDFDFPHRLLGTEHLVFWYTSHSRLHHLQRSPLSRDKMHITFKSSRIALPWQRWKRESCAFPSSIIRSCPEFKPLLFLVIEPRPDSTAPDCPRLPSTSRSCSLLRRPRKRPSCLYITSPVGLPILATLSDTNNHIVPFSSPIIQYTGEGYVAAVDVLHFKDPGLPNITLSFMGTDVYWAEIWNVQVRHFFYYLIRPASSRNALRAGVQLPRRSRRKYYAPEYRQSFWSSINVTRSPLLLYWSRS